MANTLQELLEQIVAENGSVRVSMGGSDFCRGRLTCVGDDFITVTDAALGKVVVVTAHIVTLMRISEQYATAV